MPGEFGNFGSQETSFGSLSSAPLRRRRRSPNPDPLQPFLPTQEEINAAGQQDDEETNFLFKLLQIPERLLFGQSIKGAAEKVVQGDFLGAVVKFLQNSPPVQVLDAIPGFDIVDDVSFSDIRKAWGNKSKQDTVGDFLINFSGELLLDPFGTFITPYAKIGAGAKTFKGLSVVAGAGELVADAGKLVQQVQLGQRALSVFKIPFVDTQFVFKGFTALDVPLARGIEGAVNFMNTNPVTGAIVKKFSSIGAVGGGEGMSGSILRGELRRVEQAGAGKSTAWMAEMMPMVLKNVNSPIGQLAKNDRTIQDAISIITELGIHETDNGLAIGTAINKGKEIANGEDVTRKLLGRGRYAGKTEYMNDVAQELAAAMKTGSTEDKLDAIAEWIERFPNATLPDEEAKVIAQAYGQARPIDLEYDTRGVRTPRDTLADRVLGEAGGPGVKGRAAGAEEAGGATVTLFDRAREEGKSVLEKVLNNEKIDRQELFEYIENGRSIMEQVARKESVDGLLGTVSELYLPRNITPEGMDLINKQFAGFVSSRGMKWMAGFLQGRKLSDLTKFEANLLFREIGTRTTGFRKIVQKGGDVAAAVESKVFGTKFIRSIAMVDPKTAEFFGTNPALDWALRISGGSKLQNTVGITKSALDDGSMMLHSIDTLGKIGVTEIQAKIQLGLKPIMEVTEDTLLGGKAPKYHDLSNGKALSIGISNESAASKDIALQDLRKWTTDQIISKKQTVNSQIDLLREDLRVVGAKDLDGATLHTPAGERMRDHEAALRDLKQRFKAERDPDIKDTLSREIDRSMEMVDTFKDALKREISDLRSAREDFFASARSASAEKSKKVRDIFNKKLDEPAFADEFSIYMAHRRNGHLPMLELAQTNPDLLKKMAERYGGARVKWMHQEAYDGVFGPKGLLANLSNPDWAGTIIHAMDHATSFWKAATALPFPQSRIRDWVSNIMLLGQGGVNIWKPQAWKDANRLLGGMRKGLLGTLIKRADDPIKQFTGGFDEAVKAVGTLTSPGGETIEAVDFVSRLHKEGLLNSGWIRDELGDAVGYMGDAFAADARTKLGKAFRTGWDSVIGRAADVAEWGDNQTKLIGVLSHWHAGNSLEDSIALVKKWSYNSRVGTGLTSFEKNFLGRFIPFYRFTRFAVKSQVEAFLTRPGTVTAWQKLRDAAVGLSGLDEQELNTVMPNFVKDELGIPWKADKDGNPSFLMFGSFVPIGSLGRLANGVRSLFSGEGQQFTDTIGSQLNPFIRVPLEASFNRSFYSGRDRSNYPGENEERFGVEMPSSAAELIDNVRFLSSVDRMNILNANSGAGKILFDGVKNRELQTDWLSSAFGILPFKNPRLMLSQTLDRISGQELREKGKLRYFLKHAAVKGQEGNMKTLRDLLAKTEAKRQLVQGLQERTQQ